MAATIDYDPRLVADGGGLTKKKSARLIELCLVAPNAKTGINVQAGFIGVVTDTFGGTTGDFDGKLELSLYKGSITPANLQRKTKYTSSDQPAPNQQAIILLPVAAGLDQDNGSADLTTIWDVDPGDWYVEYEYSGAVGSGLVLGLGFFAIQTPSPPQAFAVFQTFTQQGRLYVTQKVIVQT